MTVGDRIKKKRNSINMSQTELAELIGVSKQTLYKYENNIITNIPSDKIISLAKFLATTPSYLMGWDEEEKTADTEDDDNFPKDVRLMARDLLQLDPKNRDLIKRLINSMKKAGEAAKNGGNNS